MTPYLIVIQNAYPKPLPFKQATLKHWAKQPLLSLPHAELTLRFVSNDDIQQLNHTYRQKNAPTNVLAFPSQVPSHLPLPRRLLGDIVVAPDVLEAEHTELHRALDAHWAHIIIHGVLHLLGYQHEKAAETTRMQTLEKTLLHQLNFPNPYATEHAHLEL
ncbi:MAG: rRNA maturation RNase YbeY [Gammaproteobacteria bacterium]|nr:rRNA maturation RNase YbeY [Gammaproteobacteria bacterium]